MVEILTRPKDDILTEQKKPQLAICYDFDGTLAPGNMQESGFIPKIGMTKEDFWKEVSARAEKYHADNILMYMWLMLERAKANHVPIRSSDFLEFGKTITFFAGVEEWFSRIKTYGDESGVHVSHHLITAGTKEIVLGTSIAKCFDSIFASSYCFDENDVAVWPALSINYTFKTQFLFRINKGALDVFDHSIINSFVPEEKRPVPFKNMVYIGDGETDVPCFRLIKQQGGHSIAVYPEGLKEKAEKFREEGRVNFVEPADYSDGSALDRRIKAIVDKIAIDDYLYGL